jgi:hypothetical protein
MFLQDLGVQVLMRPPLRNKSNANESQMYMPQGADPTKNIYGGKTKKNKKPKKHTLKSPQKTLIKNKNKNKK